MATANRAESSATVPGSAKSGGSAASGNNTAKPAQHSARSTSKSRTAAKTSEKPSSKPRVRKSRAKPKLPFSKGEFVVYPSHGVGQVTGVESNRVANNDLRLFVIFFASDKMTLRVPVDKATASGLRKISSREDMHQVIETLRGRPRAKRSMWSRRAQEYEAKINSGDPVAVAEVVRDLYRAPDQPEQSYSERQMYESALDRLVNEYALVEKLELQSATEQIEEILGT